MKTPQFIQLHSPDDLALAQEAAAGLRAQQAHVSPKFFYDALGSRLFDAITELAEYYPTRTEASIFAEHGPAIAQAVLAATGAGPVMIDLGAGNCAKAARWFPLIEPRRYVAVDISVAFLHQALRLLQIEHPTLELLGVGLDFSDQLALPAEATGGPALVFYPGSSIGNFAPDDAHRLLRQARELAAGGALLIGVDLVKPVALMEAAYDDDLSVTAAFNLNLLKHLNRLLGADFVVGDWRHVARYDSRQARIEMHLEARTATTVRWHHDQRKFETGERIHTENSYKWTPERFSRLLIDAGYADVKHWTDPQHWFGVFLAAG